MDKLNSIFEDLAEVDEIVGNSKTVFETALDLSQDGAKAVVILCLALAKACATAKIPAQIMIPSVLEMEETYLLGEKGLLESSTDSN